MYADQKRAKMISRHPSYVMFYSYYFYYVPALVVWLSVKPYYIRIKYGLIDNQINIINYMHQICDMFYSYYLYLGNFTSWC